MDTGYSVHVGNESSYLAVFSYGSPSEPSEESYKVKGGLNHIAVVVDDLDAVEKRVVAAGYKPGTQFDYEPGKRFYFDGPDGVEFEVVSYA